MYKAPYNEKWRFQGPHGKPLPDITNVPEKVAEFEAFENADPKGRPLRPYPINEPWYKRYALYKREAYHPWPQDRPRANTMARAFERLWVHMWNSHMSKWEFGLLPPHYNKRVHGPYVPWRDYRPSAMTTPALWDTKMKDVREWFAQRDKRPANIYRAFSRKYWGWRWKWADGLRYGTVSPFLHWSMWFMLYYWLWRSQQMRNDMYYRYHW